MGFATKTGPHSAGCSGTALRSRTLRRAASAAAPRRPRVAVVGAGWGGLGAAKALCENGCDVTLLDGNQPGGSMTTPSGKPFEAGTRPGKIYSSFWVVIFLSQK